MHFRDDPGESLLHLLAFRPSMNLRCATLLELPAQDCNKMKQAATSARRLGYIPDLSVTCTKDTGATSSKKRSKRVQNVHTCNKRIQTNVKVWAAQLTPSGNVVQRIWFYPTLLRCLDHWSPMGQILRRNFSQASPRQDVMNSRLASFVKPSEAINWFFGKNLFPPQTHDENSWNMWQNRCRNMLQPWLHDWWKVQLFMRMRWLLWDLRKARHGYIFLLFFDLFLFGHLMFWQRQSPWCLMSLQSLWSLWSLRSLCRLRESSQIAPSSCAWSRPGHGQSKGQSDLTDPNSLFLKYSMPIVPAME